MKKVLCTFILEVSLNLVICLVSIELAMKLDERFCHLIRIKIIKLCEIFKNLVEIRITFIDGKINNKEY